MSRETLSEETKLVSSDLIEIECRGKSTLSALTYFFPEVYDNMVFDAQMEFKEFPIKWCYTIVMLSVATSLRDINLLLRRKMS